MTLDLFVKVTGTVGIFVSLLGVFMLFRYGMPFRVESKGGTPILWDDIDHEGLARDKVYRRRGMIGLGLIVLGTGLQILALWLG